MSNPSGPPSAWTVVMPVKGLSSAKSRMGDPSARALAFAFFQDTAAAVLACPSVSRLIVVTGDPDIASWARQRHADVVSDIGYAGINAAAAHASASMPRGTATAVMVSDLPAATAAALGAALALAEPHETSFLTDVEGTGTTMWMTRGGRPVSTAFGADSRVRHAAAGAVDLVERYGPDPAVLAVRRDVDRAEDLQQALMLGVGSATSAALRESSTPA